MGVTVEAYIQTLPGWPGEAGRMRFAGPPASEGEVAIEVRAFSALGLVFRSNEALTVGDVLGIELPDATIAQARVAWVSGELVACDIDISITAYFNPLEQPSDVIGLTIEADAAYDNGFASRLLRLRRERGITQDKLAKALAVSVPAVSAWEVGRSRPKRDRMEALAQIFKIPLVDLLGLSGEVPFPAQIASARKAIAKAAGVDEDDVRIQVNF